MLGYNKDVYNSQALVNNFKEGHNHFYLKDFNYLPTIDLTLTTSKTLFRDQSLDKSNGIDLFEDSAFNDENFKDFDIRDLNMDKLTNFVKI